VHRPQCLRPSAEERAAGVDLERDRFRNRGCRRDPFIDREPREWRQAARVVTDWELKRYLEII